MNCDYCPEEFRDSMDGLIIKTFHVMIRHTDKEINGVENRNEWGEEWVEYGK